RAGSRDDPRTWVGLRVFVSILMGIIGFLIPFSVFPLANFLFNANINFEPLISAILMIGFAIAGLIGTIVIFYLHISYVVDGRKKMVESILPDFLFLVGNNLKSGMAPFYAFRSAVRPEFGPLSEEIKIATQKSLGVESFSEALKQIGERIDSKVLSDTTKFFAQALRSGGHLAQLIETTASDIKQTNRLKNELVTSTKMYTMFILFVVIVASPMLLSVSVEFLHILGGISAQTAGISGGMDSKAIQEQSGMGLTAGAVSITPEFMQTLGYFIIFVNSLLASVFIGTLGGGKIRDGLKYAPLMIIAGLVLFVICLALVSGILGGFTGL
ncbi:MAG: type II secretion system F family protein, partial [Candidatus Diapherotrites archaeon]|nr:type II secretion system F family protein [Candidatus Diapherotrites archaeon]